MSKIEIRRSNKFPGLGASRSTVYREVGDRWVLVPTHPRNSDGYLCVPYKPYKASNQVYAHQVIADAWYDKLSYVETNHLPSQRLVHNHIDRNPTNNRISNLELVTDKQNLAHGRGVKDYRLFPVSARALKEQADTQFVLNVINTKRAELGFSPVVYQP